ncbi:MAG: NAD(P)H-quinone oxidoreductase [Burkholderiales bacterium 70-64]|nr:MAG: NAD(P)H-quinone oxidoreductase [Burkholderiales bacterium 70-64]
MSEIASSMRYVEHGAGGPPAVLRPARTGVPRPGPGEVLIAVAFAGVNRPDVAQRQGRYPPPPGASPVLGLEVSGRVVALGEGVGGLRVGDAVCALANGGGYAEYAAVPAGQVLPVPQGLSLLQAAALPENFFTVWTNVFERGRLAAGESFLVHGGSSGIGLTAIQLAHARGATAYATVGGPEKAEACRRLGAAEAIDYRREDFVERIAALTGKRGVDLILDMVGGDYIARNFRALAVEGRLVQIAFLNGPKAEIDCTPLMVKRLTWTGSTLRPRSAADKAAIAVQLREQVWPLLASGKVQPVIHEVFDLDDAARAHELMESSRHIGKIMLRVAGE